MYINKFKKSAAIDLSHSLIQGPSFQQFGDFPVLTQPLRKGDFKSFLLLHFDQIIGKDDQRSITVSLQMPRVSDPQFEVEEDTGQHRNYLQIVNCDVS